MTKILLFFLISLIYSNERQPCLKQSPALQIAYNYQNIKNQGDILFCKEVSGRTCCDKDNFEQLKIHWLKILQASKDIISTSCLQQYREILCSECDGSVSQGITQGLCKFQCDDLYQNCKDDYFKFDNLSFRFCDQNALLCSKLQDIFDDSYKFCKEMKFPINDNKNCYNLTTSQQILGNARNKDKIHKQEDQKQEDKKQKDKKQTIYQKIISFLKNLF